MEEPESEPVRYGIGGTIKILGGTITAEGGKQTGAGIGGGTEWKV